MQKLLSKVLFLAVFVMSASVLLPMANASAAQTNYGYLNNVVNVGHRGASGHAPENTIASFDKAVEMHADYIELDVQVTKDGKLIVMHDTTVDRTTNGTGAIRNLTYDYIKQLDAGSWYDESFAGAKVPTFGEVLDRYRGKVGILIEIKSPGLYPKIEEKVAEALIARNMDKPNNEKLIYQSFGWESVQEFHEILPSFPTAVLEGYGKAVDGKITNEQLESVSEYADYINPNQGLLDQDTVNRIHQHNLKTWPYTITTKDQLDRLTDLGVDGIITNYPEFLNIHKRN